MNLGFNLKEGINFCAPKNNIGFRGVANGMARLIPLCTCRDKEIGFFNGIDVPADRLPYIPDMGEDSEFIKKGYWHYYLIRTAVFIVHLTPSIGSTYNMRKVLFVIFFTNEDRPRVLLDERHSLEEQGILSATDLKEIRSILAAQEINN